VHVYRHLPSSLFELETLEQIDISGTSSGTVDFNGVDQSQHSRRKWNDFQRSLRLDFFLKPRNISKVKQLSLQTHFVMYLTRVTFKILQYLLKTYSGALLTELSSLPRPKSLSSRLFAGAKARVTCFDKTPSLLGT
jgi:hypothetical protein